MFSSDWAAVNPPHFAIVAKIRGKRRPRLAAVLSMWPPHEESNLDFRFRRPVFYPLNYGEAKLE